MKKSIIFTLLGLILLSSLLGMVSAATNGPATVNVGLYVLNLGKFDISTGSFTVDFYLSMSCNKVCPNYDFEFMNGRANSFEKITDEKNEKFYRIQANLNSPIDLKKFPFDKQELHIILEDKTLTSDELVYTISREQSGIDPEIIFSGWKLGEWNVTIGEHYYKVYDENYSQYDFTIPISKIVWNSMIKTLLPVIFIILVMLSSFVLDPDKISTRLAMVGSALVASVMFHVSLANQIPAVGYLTFADKFMLLTYFVLVMSFAFNVTLMELHERKKEGMVEKFHRATEFTMFLVVPLLYVLLFILSL